MSLYILRACSVLLIFSVYFFYLFSDSASLPLKHYAEGRQKGGINRMETQRRVERPRSIQRQVTRDSQTERQSNRRIVYHRIRPAGAPAEASHLRFSDPS